MLIAYCSDGFARGSRRAVASNLVRSNHGPHAAVGHNFEQQGMIDTTVDDVNSINTGLGGIKR
jgi:hypothetical protein